HEAGQLARPLRRGARAEIQVYLPELQGVSIGERNRESACRIPGRAPGGRPRACLTEDNRCHTPVDDEEEHSPEDGAESPDKPPAARPAPAMRQTTAGRPARLRVLGRRLVARAVHVRLRTAING